MLDEAKWMIQVVFGIEKLKVKTGISLFFITFKQNLYIFTINITFQNLLPNNKRSVIIQLC